MGKPEIRFKGYTDEWEQRKLDDWGNFYYGRSCPKWSVTEDATIPCIRYGELYTKFGAKIDRVYSYTNMPPDNLRFSKGTEVLIPRVGEDPMDYNHCTWLSMQDVAIGEMISVFNTDNNPLFTATMFNATLQNEFAMRVEGGSVTNLYFEKLKNIEVSFPSIPEQEKIASYFENFDNLITLHQRKCDEVKSLKKYMLQKMFPQNEQKVPEIRFEGFTEAWEQRKFSEGVSEIGDGLHGTPIYCEDGNVYFINGNNLIDGKIVISAETKKVNESQQSTADKSLDDTTILMSINGTIGNLAYYSGERLMLGKSAAYIKVSEFDKRFVYAYLQAPSVQGYFMDSLTGTTIKNLGLKAIREMIMFIPQDVDEQKRIGKFLNHLDHLITLHQRKPISHLNHPIIHTKHKGEEKYVRIRVNDRGKINRTANLRRFPVDIPGGFKDGGRTVGEFQIYSGAE